MQETTFEELNKSLERARLAFKEWKKTSLESRIHLLHRYATLLKDFGDELALLISEEMGKPFWESKTEVSAMQQKVDISIEAYRERCQQKSVTLPHAKLEVLFRPQGVVAVLGPFNFPGHLPNGHFVPALLAGNVVLFKPSEWTPKVGAKILEWILESGFPDAVFQVVYGGAKLGESLVGDSRVQGVFFTGSFPVGQSLNLKFATQPGKILALEMGGNNPLVVSKITDPTAASVLTIQSAFITSGQRCTCARRLILVKSQQSEAYLKTLIELTKKIKIGSYKDRPEPYMGPVVNSKAAEKLLHAQENLLKSGAKPLLEMKRWDQNFVSPAILDVTGIFIEDEEHFGPLLQLIHVESLEEAIAVANQTQYGLAASLLSESFEEWNQFSDEIEAGVVNWNSSTTGASSLAPFGGIKDSGNNRPSGYLAADYCTYPVASLLNAKIALPEKLPPGISL